MTPAQVATLTPWTDAQLILLYRDALANGWGGTTRNINGRSVQFAAPNVLLDLIERLEARVLAAASTDDPGGALGRVSLATFADDPR